MYVAIDPGAGRTTTIGVAEFKNSGSLTSLHQFTWEEFNEFLESLDPKEVKKLIVEDYRIQKHKLTSHVGSRVETIQTIGAIRGWAHRYRIEIVFQRSNILEVAQLWFDIKIPSDHSRSHQISALLHGLFYLHSIGLARTKLEDEYAARNDRVRKPK
jgi:hypothetical protein